MYFSEVGKKDLLWFKGYSLHFWPLILSFTLCHVSQSTLSRVYFNKTKTTKNGVLHIYYERSLLFYDVMMFLCFYFYPAGCLDIESREIHKNVLMICVTLSGQTIWISWEINIGLFAQEYLSVWSLQHSVATKQ